MTDLINRQVAIDEIHKTMERFATNWLQDMYIHYGLDIANRVISKQPTIEANIDSDVILRLCNEIEMIIVTVCDTGYTLQDGDVEAIMKRTKAIRRELTGDAGTD